jgi:sugar lactone lactonase YvrE
VIAAHRHDWGVELAGFGRPFGLGIDAHDRLHVTDMDRHDLVRFDPDFQHHDVLVGPGVFNGPHSVDFAADGRLFVTCYYTPAIYEISGGVPRRLDAPVTGPASSIVDSSGRLLVAEYSQNAILALHPDGRLSHAFEGSFDRPHMARPLPSGDVLIADTWNNRLQRCGADGKLIDPRAASMSCPVAIDADPDRGWLVTAWGDNCVLRFDAAGRPGGRLDAPALDKPYDARWLSGGRVAVADSHHARVLVLDSPQFH